MYSRTLWLQGAVLAAIFVTSLCVGNSEPGTVDGGAQGGAQDGDQGVVVVSPPSTTLPGYLFTTLSMYRSTPNKLPDTTQYRHTPGNTPRATVMTDAPRITNKPSTILPAMTPSPFPPFQVVTDPPFVGDGAESVFGRRFVPLCLQLALTTLLCLGLQRLLR